MAADGARQWHRQRPCCRRAPYRAAHAAWRDPYDVADGSTLPSVRLPAYREGSPKGGPHAPRLARLAASDPDQPDGPGCAIALAHVLLGWHDQRIGEGRRRDERQPRGRRRGKP